ncbi:MAG: hypothetical protein ACYST6_21330 [Planctomycetota bacterium]|jgi:hypothetical protein
MKRIILFLAVLLLFTVTARADLSAWLMGGNDLVNARLGYVKGDIEVGGQVSWTEEDPPQLYGAYGLYFFPDLIDVNSPVGMAFLPATVTARPYIGAQVSIATEDDHRTMIGPVAGLELVDVITIEYQYLNYSDNMGDALENEHRVMFGLRMQF